MNDIQKELIEYIKDNTPPYREEDEITIAEYAEEMKATYSTVSRRLNNLVQSGKLVRRKALTQANKGLVWVYKKKE